MDNQQTVEEAFQDQSPYGAHPNPRLQGEADAWENGFKAGAKWQQSHPVPTNTGEGESKMKFKDWEHMLKNAVYITLIGYQQPNGYSMPCKIREHLEAKILERFKHNLSRSNYADPQPPQQSANPEGEWISPEDAELTHGKEYLIFMPDMNRVCSAFYHGGLQWRLFDNYITKSTVTHCMPLPKPPMKSDEGDSLYNDKK